MVAALAVAWFQSGIPDLIVAGVMAALFLTSSWQILAQSWASGGMPTRTTLMITTITPATRPNLPVQRPIPSILSGRGLR